MILAILSAGTVCVAGLLAAAPLPTSAVAVSPPHPVAAAKETQVIRRCLKRSALGRCERWSLPSRRPLVDAATSPRLLKP